MFPECANIYDSNYEGSDLEIYRNPLEPPNHWHIKKAFLKAHMLKYPEARLLALTNTFYNIEFMGARYHLELEQLIKQLSEEVPEIVEYRFKRKNNLKRTFVSASDASKAKCQRTELKISKDDSEKKKKTFQKKSVKKDKDTIFIKGEMQSNDLIRKVQCQNGARGKLIIYRHNTRTDNCAPYQLLKESAQKLRMELVLKRTGITKQDMFEYELCIDGDCILKEYAENDRIARERLGFKALTELEQYCFTVMIKSHTDGHSVTRSDTTPTDTPPTLMPADNKGMRIMKLMGWTGEGGLGRKGDGIRVPVEAVRCISRVGLDLRDKGADALRDKVQAHLEGYIREQVTDNLVFSTEFTNEERKLIHSIAQKLQLKSKSYGKNEDRRLVVSKKLTPWELVALLLANDDQTRNYKLIRPAKIL